MFYVFFKISLQVNVDPNSGIFITMNPAGKGYGGRQKLPDNLKQLFRPVAMSKPDNELIAEVILFSEGFKDARNLGRKLVAIFNLSRFVCWTNATSVFDIYLNYWIYTFIQLILSNVCNSSSVT